MLEGFCGQATTQQEHTFCDSIVSLALEVRFLKTI